MVPPKLQLFYAASTVHIIDADNILPHNPLQCLARRSAYGPPMAEERPPVAPPDAMPGSPWVRPLNSVEAFMAAAGRVGTMTTVQGAHLSCSAPLQEGALRAALQRWSRSVEGAEAKGAAVGCSAGFYIEHSLEVFKCSYVLVCTKL